jgi:CubicO group peptidase (beta-lactamase class C family)
MNPAFKRWLIVALLLALILGATLARAADGPPAAVLNPGLPPSDAPAALQEEIAVILQRTHTPGAGVAIVRREGPEWIAGIGLADVAAQHPVTPDTLFRIGSLSKSFVALSILKLQEEGKLNLQDPLKSRAPDLACENPWEQTDPVRLVHLLEHTSGWDDLGASDYAFNPAKDATLKEGLALRPMNRRARWRPGTRFAYSNTGPAAAAYVVEQVTGQRFEDYVEQVWFRPLGMTTASYFGTPETLSRLTKLYRPDGTALPYWKISVRPTGAINASTREMANYLQFYLNRGAFGGVQLLPAAAIDRMERATTTYAAREGLDVGYGLGNYATVRYGWVNHGHDGALEGGLTQMVYLPETGAGYVVMINTNRFDALGGIAKLLSNELTRNLPPPTNPPVARVPPKVARQYAGWYEIVSLRYESIRFIARFLCFSKVSFDEGRLIRRLLPKGQGVWVAVSDHQFRREADPVPTLTLIADRSEGTFIQTTGGIGGFTLRHVPGWWVTLQLGTGTGAALLMLTTVAFTLVWVPRWLLGRMRGVAHLSIRLLPLLATLSVATSLAFFLLPGGAPEAIQRFGRVTPWSVTLFLLTLALPAFAVAGVVQALRHRRANIRRFVWWHSFITSVMMTIVSIYLAYWGVIGLRSWV